MGTHGKIEPERPLWDAVRSDDQLYKASVAVEQTRNLLMPSFFPFRAPSDRRFLARSKLKGRLVFLSLRSLSDLPVIGGKPDSYGS
jgi:hypothetical protein